MGPARSESSIMCWEMGCRGLSTVSVCLLKVDHSSLAIIPFLRKKYIFAIHIQKDTNNCTQFCTRPLDLLQQCHDAARSHCFFKRTFPLICPKFTPNSSNSDGSPSYPSVPNAAIHPVLNPPCSPMRPLTPCPPKLGAAPNPPALA